LFLYHNHTTTQGTGQQIATNRHRDTVSWGCYCRILSLVEGICGSEKGRPRSNLGNP
jgi:hypothetical protein